jgi:class 3 adenylate cyclase
VDIAGSTRLLAHHPPEAVLGVVQCFSALVTEIARDHDGRVKDFEGDGVLLYFDSARRAAEAALAIHAALDHRGCDAGCEGGPAATVRMSLTVGDVVVGAIGSPSAPALALVGPSVNLGARLLKVLPPGGIVASEDTVAALLVESPTLAGRFRLLDAAWEVPAADGLTVAVYALAEPGPHGALPPRRPRPREDRGAPAPVRG